MADERQIVDDYSNSPSLNRNFSGPAVLSDSENMEFNHSFSQLQLTNELDSMIKTNEPHQENQNLDYMKPLSKIGLVDVILLQQNMNNEKEYLSNLEVYMTKDNEVLLSNLVESLKMMGFSLEGSMIFYYDFQADLYVYCGNDPLRNNIYISVQGKKSKQIMLKYRKPQHLLNKVKEDYESITNQNSNNFEEEKKQNNFIPQNKKRIKERVIGDVIDKVVRWRQLHDGTEENGRKVQIPLDIAAQRVGISKKTLDDYLFQIKLGKKYNFNFQDHKNDKIGILRSFVKKHRQIEKESERQSLLDNSNFDDLTTEMSQISRKEHHCTSSCHRNNSPSCKNEAKKEFDYMDFFCDDNHNRDDKKGYFNDNNYYSKPQETF